MPTVIKTNQNLIKSKDLKFFSRRDKLLDTYDITY